VLPHLPRPWGRDAQPLEQLVIDEEMRAAGVQAHNLAIGAWVVPTLIQYGTTEQQQRFLAATLRLDYLWCQLFSEPGAGSDLAGLRTRAERVDGGWRITGQKIWISLAKQAAWGICIARTDPAAPRHDGISYFLVDMRSPGIDVRPLREITGDASFNQVFLDNVSCQTAAGSAASTAAGGSPARRSRTSAYRCPRRGRSELAWRNCWAWRGRQTSRRPATSAGWSARAGRSTSWGSG